MHESWTKQFVNLKWALDNLKNMPIYYPSGKYKLSIRSYSEYYCYKIVFLHINFFEPLKMFGAWHKCAQTFFSPEFDNNFDQVFQLYNNATFFCEILFLH